MQSSVAIKDSCFSSKRGSGDEQLHGIASTYFVNLMKAITLIAHFRARENRLLVSSHIKDGLESNPFLDGW